MLRAGRRAFIEARAWPSGVLSFRVLSKLSDSSRSACLSNRDPTDRANLLEQVGRRAGARTHEMRAARRDSPRLRGQYLGMVMLLQRAGSARYDRFEGIERRRETSHSGRKAAGRPNSRTGSGVADQHPNRRVAAIGARSALAITNRRRDVIRLPPAGNLLRLSCRQLHPRDRKRRCRRARSSRRDSWRGTAGDSPRRKRTRARHGSRW